MSTDNVRGFYMPEPTKITFTNYANLRANPPSDGSKEVPVAAFGTTTKIDDGPPPYKRNAFSRLQIKHNVDFTVWQTF